MQFAPATPENEYDDEYSDEHADIDPNRPHNEPLLGLKALLGVLLKEKSK